MFDETSAPGLNSACTTDENGMFTAPKQSVATHSNTIKITNAIKPINNRRKTILQLFKLNHRKFQ